MTIENGKKKLLVVLYAVLISFILLSMSSFLAEDYIATQLEEKYEYHLIFPVDGYQSHYYVERVNRASDGVIDLSYVPETNTLIG